VVHHHRRLDVNWIAVKANDRVRKVATMFNWIRRIGVAAVPATVVGLLAVSATASATGASQPQRRQLAATTLSEFRVVVTATREPGHPLLATVTAAGFRRSGSHWQLIARKRIGKASGWFWFAVQTCSLQTTQFKNNTTSPSPAVVRFDSIKLSLLITPSIGCSGTFSKRWTP
jgi:hypothetical protein